MLPVYKKSAADLLQVPVGRVGLAGLEHNAVVTVLFIEAWLRRNILFIYLFIIL